MSSIAHGEGFVQGTLVKTPNGYVDIAELKIGDGVVCYDFNGSCVEKPITDVIKKHTEMCIELVVNGEKIYVAPDQKFYLPREREWIEAKDLVSGHVLLSHCATFFTVDDLRHIFLDEDVYDVTVKDFHNFCVSRHDIHVHNFFPLIAIGITWTIGEGIAIAGGIGFGAAIVGTALYQSSKNARPHTFDRWDAHEMPTVLEDRAPGKPTADDGFFPGKKWDGKKVRAPNGKGYGYPDKDGSVWVPTGVGGAQPGTVGDAHSGPHWDVQHPGGGYDNVYPGGKVRPGKPGKGK